MSTTFRHSFFVLSECVAEYLRSSKRTILAKLFMHRTDVGVTLGMLVLRERPNNAVAAVLSLTTDGKGPKWWTKLQVVARTGWRVASIVSVCQCNSVWRETARATNSDRSAGGSEDDPHAALCPNNVFIGCFSSESIDKTNGTNASVDVLLWALRATIEACPTTVEDRPN